MVMRLHCEIDQKSWSSSTARFWNHQNDKKFGPVFMKLQALYTERGIWDYAHVRDMCVFISHSPIDKLIYQIYKIPVVGGKPKSLRFLCQTFNR